MEMPAFGFGARFACGFLILSVVLFATLAPSTVQAAGVVGTGTAASCTDATLDAALAGGGLVTFNCGGPATIDISTGTGTKEIAASTFIDGGGMMTISGGGTAGEYGGGLAVFIVPSGVNFTIDALTIVNGSNAIYNSGVLTMTNSTFFGNGSYGSPGAAIRNDGTATVTGSTFESNIESCFLCAAAGGAIANYGTLTVTNSTFFGGLGGAILSSGDTLMVANSTFFGNDYDIWTETRCGVNFSAPCRATLRNTLIASCDGDFSAIVIDGGHNIDSGTSCGFSAANGSLSNTDPQLDPAGLRDNGGPTRTIALLAGSPAINAGDDTACAVPPVNNRDQRDFVRPGAGATHCSIGAYEYACNGQGCVGDCDSCGSVGISELVKGVNLLFERSPLEECPSFDVDNSDAVEINELVQAVTNALGGCP